MMAHNSFELPSRELTLEFHKKNSIARDVARLGVRGRISPPPE